MYISTVSGTIELYASAKSDHYTRGVLIPLQRGGLQQCTVCTDLEEVVVAIAIQMAGLMDMIVKSPKLFDLK